MAPKRRTQQALAQPRAKAAKSSGAGAMAGGGGRAGDECAPVLELLGLAGEMSDACRQCLATMAPHCLSVPTDRRDAYQRSVVDAIARLAADVDARHRAAVEEAKVAVAETESKRGVAAATVAEAARIVAKQNDECDVKRDASKSTEVCSLAATESLSQKRAELERIRSQITAMEAERSKLQTLVSETVPLLRMGTVADHPGSCQQNDEMIDSVAAVLQQIGVEKPCVDAVSEMFRLSPGDRSQFSKNILMSAEEAVAGHLVALEARLGELGCDFSKEEAAHIEAEAVATSARKQHDSRMEEYMTVEIELVKAEAALHKAEDAENAIKREIAQRMKAVDGAMQRLGVAQFFIERFDALRQREDHVAPPSAESIKSKVSPDQCVSEVRTAATSGGA